VHCGVTLVLTADFDSNMMRLFMSTLFSSFSVFEHAMPCVS